MNYEIPLTCQVKGLNEIYLRYFGYKKNGLFVDVGAYDGIQHSNTWGLAQAGWSGICYEPVPEAYAQCIKNHEKHRVINDNHCIGNFAGTVELTLAGTLSTYNQDQINSEYWSQEYENRKIITTKIVTLDKSLEGYRFPPSFDVLSLDTEGSESDVLKAFDISYWRPKLAIVEAQELHPSEGLRLQAPFINDFFFLAGYTKIYCDEINNIYLRGDLSG